jgi:hypothetical protein
MPRESVKTRFFALLRMTRATWVTTSGPILRLHQPCASIYAYPKREEAASGLFPLWICKLIGVTGYFVAVGVTGGCGAPELEPGAPLLLGAVVAAGIVCTVPVVTTVAVNWATAVVVASALA